MGYIRTQFPIPKKKLSTFVGKFLTLTLLIGGLIYKLTYRFVQSSNGDTLLPVDYIGLVLLLSTYLLIGGFIVIERKKNIHTSPFQFYFWVCHTLFSIPQFVKDVKDLLDGNVDLTWPWISALTGLPVILCALVLNCISDHLRDDLPPDVRASHLSFLTFSWMDNLVWKG